MVSFFPPSSPRLPSGLRSLIVKGKYHATAPIHICLDHVSQTTESLAILFSPSQIDLMDSIEQFNDAWLEPRLGSGNFIDCASRIKFFFPPTPASMAAILAALHVPDHTEISRSNTLQHLNLDSAPTLVVLHQLSAFFRSPSSRPWKFSSYLTLVLRAFGAMSCLNGNSMGGEKPLIVLFEADLDSFQLPISGTHHAMGTTSVLHPLSCYFEGICMFHLGEDSESKDGNERPASLNLRKCDHEEGEPIQSIHWVEKRKVEGTTFHFQ